MKNDKEKEGDERVQMLYTKYRPTTFDEMVGNKTIVKALKKSIGTTRFYFLHGKRGCGKTTLARIIANEIGVHHYDVFEIDAPSARGIDKAKELKSGIYTRAAHGEYKMYIIDECHLLTPEAQSVFLKVLEEPPRHVFFVFCTTEPQKTLATIRSRAEPYQVRALKRREMLDLLNRVAEEEGMKIDNSVLLQICDVAEGVPREGLVYLGMVKGLEAHEALELLEEGTTVDRPTVELCKVLLGHDTKKGKWDMCRHLLRHIEEEPETVRRGILGYLSAVCMNSHEPIPHVSRLADEFLDNMYDSGKPGLVLAVMRACLI